jgi:hypothetical protein
LIQVTARLQGWRNTLGSKALETVDKLLINDNKGNMEKYIRELREENPSCELTVKDLIVEQIEAHLERKPLQPGSELYTYAYQWSNWNGGVDSKVSQC